MILYDVRMILFYCEFLGSTVTPTNNAILMGKEKVFCVPILTGQNREMFQGSTLTPKSNSIILMGRYKVFLTE